MDPRIIEVRRNVIFSVELNDEDTISHHINIEFMPDEVIIRSILYTIKDPTDPENCNTSIYTNLVSDYIGSFSDQPSGNSVTPNLVFPLRRAVNKEYEFSIHKMSAAGDMELKGRTGDLTLHLEFVKYRM